VRHANTHTMSNTKKIRFSGNFISIDNKRVDINHFREILNKSEETEVFGNIVHSYSIEFNSNFLKVNISDGSTFPRNQKVINIKTNQSEPNPRQPNQIEPKECFAIIDFETGFLWISNGKKRSILIEFLKRKFVNSKIIVKDVFDQEEFIKAIKRLDDIRVTTTPNLFSATNTLTHALADEINQTEAVEAVLHLKYQNKWVGNNLSNRISSIFKHKENFKGIMISGRDEKNNGMLFNTNVFSKKIEFYAKVDDNEMFDSDEVFNILIEKINNEKS
jgi:hypothetical protein